MVNDRLWKKFTSIKNFIKERALEFAKTSNCPNFKIVLAGLTSLNYGMFLYKILYGKRADVKEEDFLSWKENVLPKLQREYNENDIFNADKTSLFFK